MGDGGPGRLSYIADRVNPSAPGPDMLSIFLFPAARHPGFEVVSFSGRKHLVVSTVSWFGGANSFLGISYIVVGSLCLFLAALFGIKQATCPRKLGDTRYLVGRLGGCGIGTPEGPGAWRQSLIYSYHIT